MTSQHQDEPYYACRQNNNLSLNSRIELMRAEQQSLNAGEDPVIVKSDNSVGEVATNQQSFLNSDLHPYLRQERNDS